MRPKSMSEWFKFRREEAGGDEGDHRTTLRDIERDSWISYESLKEFEAGVPCLTEDEIKRLVNLFDSFGPYDLDDKNWEATKLKLLNQEF